MKVRGRRPFGFKHVLFVRISDELDVAINTRVEMQREQTPWVVATRADVVRQILHDALLGKKGDEDAG